MRAEGLTVGIDIGGTFSDVVAVSAAREVLAAFKVPSTPAEPEAAVLEGLRKLATMSIGGDDIPTTMFHGTTVATNALIQKRGAHTALLATEGFTDIVALRRQARPDLYRLDQRVSAPLVGHGQRISVGERIRADGTVEQELQGESIRKIAAELREQGVDSIAVSFLHSYANPIHEQAAVAILREEIPEVTVSASSELSPEVGEFERTSTTVVNAYVTPIVQEYLGRLSRHCLELGIDDVQVVKSNGGLTSAANAARQPVHLIESGPAAGLNAVAQLGRRLGIDNLIAFDMGGTTAKIGVIRNGAPQLSRELLADRYVDGRDVGGYVIRSPVIDLAEIGSGGGSIAWIDAAGSLRIGPHSAGSDPGPACYGLGNDQPTVTDAHLVVGTLDAESHAVPGGLDIDRARRAVDTHVARPLGWSIERAARALLRLATANMAETVRLVTVRRGVDIRDFTLICYGGAGPLHATDIARDVGIRRVIVPQHPAVFSSFGALMCDVRHDLVQSVLRPTGELTASGLERSFEGLAARAENLLANESAGVNDAPVQHRRLLDMRHEGQLHEIAVPVEPGALPERVACDFREIYQQHYGYSLPDSAVELVNARLEVVRTRWRDGSFPSTATTLSTAETPAAATRMVLDGNDGVRQLPIISRDEIVQRGDVRGPFLLADEGTVTPVREQQVARPLIEEAVIITEETDG